LRPSSTWVSSRPRNTTVTTTLCSKRPFAYLILNSMSWSPVFGRRRISLVFV
jgi:hypothetical protein